MRKKVFALILSFINSLMFGQVPFPHTANDAGVMMAKRIASFSVVGAGNDRFEIANATNFDGQFVPQLWSYRETDNRFTLGISANISSSTDNGTSPLMIFSAAIPTQLQLNAPTTGVYLWGNTGTSTSIVNRPLFQWNNANNRLMTIIANDNLGLGTVNPTACFHNLSSVRFKNLANSTNPDFILGSDASGNVFEYNVSSLAGNSDADWLKPDGTIAMSIDDKIYINGKVGIGVNSFPSLLGTEDVSFYSMFVEGGVLKEEVRVALTSDLADYVFKKEYKLPTLQKVEEHIKKEGHLKDIPSAKEVKENGIVLGEMSKLLLQKIEELTLYVIDLNKKNEDQKYLINKLNNSKKYA